MKQLLLAVLLALALGAAFVVTSGIQSIAGDQCAAVDNPDNQP
jgi:hypothetical protein